MEGITFDAEITYQGSSYTCRANAGLGGIFSLEFLKPANLEGLKLRFDGTDFVVEFMGLTYQPNLEQTAFADTVRMLKNIMASLAAGNRSEPQGTDGAIIEDKLGTTDYKFYLDAAGMPLRLEVPSADLTVDFLNVTLAS